jgi:hypothetical protein
MVAKQLWSKPQLSLYGNVEDITEQRTGSISKTAGSTDVINVTIGGVTSSVTSGAAAGGSLISRPSVH